MITSHTLIHADTVSTILWIVVAALLSVLGRGKVKVDISL